MIKVTTKEIKKTVKVSEVHIQLDEQSARGLLHMLGATTDESTRKIIGRYCKKGAAALEYHMVNEAVLPRLYEQLEDALDE